MAGSTFRVTAWNHYSEEHPGVAPESYLFLSMQKILEILFIYFPSLQNYKEIKLNYTLYIG